MTVLRHQYGLSLIELLIVITIMMGMMSLTAPFAMNVIDKAKAQTELIALENILKKSSTKAFTSGKGLIVRLKGNRLEVIVQPSKRLFQIIEQEASPILTKEFEFLSFTNQELVFNSNGFSNANSITFLSRGLNKSIELN